MKRVNKKGWTFFERVLVQEREKIFYTRNSVYKKEFVQEMRKLLYKKIQVRQWVCSRERDHISSEGSLFKREEWCKS